MQKQLQTLLQKEMSRKEFLTTVGFGMASVFGFSHLVTVLLPKGQTRSMGAGYGASAYGGVDKR